MEVKWRIKKMWMFAFYESHWQQNVKNRLVYLLIAMQRMQYREKIKGRVKNLHTLLKFDLLLATNTNVSNIPMYTILWLWA